MTSQSPSYHGYRFPPEIISHAVWLYHRLCLSFRDAEDLFAQRGVTVAYETIRQWCRTFGPGYARTLRRRRGPMGDTWHLDELFVKYPRAAALSLAGGRRGRRRDRHPHAIPARSACRYALLPEVVETPRIGTSTFDHGQAAQLRRGSSSPVA